MQVPERLKKLPTRALRAVLKASYAVLTSRRQLNLKRWIRTRRFQDLHGHVVEWLDQHYATLERGSPWLHLVGTDAWDYCSGRVHSLFEISLQPRYKASAGCTRDVIVVYGFDGDLTQRLHQLEPVLSTAGWTRTGPLPLQPWAQAQAAVMRWEPTTALTYAPGLEEIPPYYERKLTPFMWLSWYSRGQTSRLAPSPYGRKALNTRNHQAVQADSTEYWRFPASALAQYEHALVVHVILGYYGDQAALGWRHRIPRYLLPTRPEGHINTTKAVSTVTLFPRPDVTLFPKVGPLVDVLL
jgi:hypothetical protein